MGSPEYPRFVFVGGCERSGTSLLQRLLCAHSRIAGGPELMFGGRIADLHQHMSWILRRGAEPYRERLGAFLGSDELDRHFRDFYRGLFRDLVRVREPPLFISEKTPSNIFAAASLLELFPDSRFVHLIRDGRDVVASHRDVAARAYAVAEGCRGSIPSLRQVCARWSLTIDSHFAILDDPAIAGRYHWLLFEDLVLDPERTMAELVGFLGLELEVEQLHPESLAAASVAVVDGVWHAEEQAPSGFDRDRIGRWRNDLGFGSRRLAEWMMAPALSRLRYPTTRAAVPIGRISGPSRSSRAVDARPLSAHAARTKGPSESGTSSADTPCGRCLFAARSSLLSFSSSSSTSFVRSSSAGPASGLA